MTTMFLELRQLDIQYPGSTAPAVRGVNLGLRSGDIGVLIGPSGCGKTTLLRAVAGLEPVTGGQILLSNRVVSEKGHTEPAERRRIGMVFQDYALFPHMDVGRNVGFGLEHLPKAERQKRIDDVLELVGLTGSDKRFPHELSGGQQQRVALARSLAKRPQLLLLDEPLGALDKKLREQTQFELVNIIESVGVTCVMVTHDQEEAMTMASRIAVMRQGKVLQVGTPREIYEQPNCLFVADFIGNVNLFEGQLQHTSPGRCEISSPEGVLAVTHSVSGTSDPIGTAVSLAVRPEKIHIAKSRPGVSDNLFTGKVREIAYFGSYSTFIVDMPSGKSVKITEGNTARQDENPITWGDEVFFWWDSAAPVLLTQ
jgi:putrescine transport system ATP-binding protein